MAGRFGGMAFHAESHVSFTLSSESARSLRMPFATRSLMHAAFDAMHLSARSYDRIRR